jgi:hypothetical protein
VEIHKLNSSSNIIKIIKLRKIKWHRNLESMRKVEMQIKAIRKVSKSKDHMRDIGVDGKINIKIDLRERD